MEHNSTNRNKWYMVSGKPLGGYVLIQADHLLRLWIAYRKSDIDLLELRIWIACNELTARRCCMNHRLKAFYKIEELLPLIQNVTLPRLKKAVHNLEKAGFLDWQDSRIGLVPACCENDSLYAMRQAVQNWRRKVPIPRRVLRFLAGCSRKVMIATVLGHLLRCLYYRNGKSVSGGRCKASWIADVFGIDLRNVKYARQELICNGWLKIHNSSQTALNRWGLAVTMNLEHDFKKENICCLPPHSMLSASQLPPPDINRKLSSRNNNQKPGICSVSGVSVGKLKEPNIQQLILDDLKEPKRLENLFRQAVGVGIISSAPADKLRWFSVAERALQCGIENPCGLFFQLCRKRLWNYITNEQENNARMKLKWLENEGPGQSVRHTIPQFIFDSSGRANILFQKTDIDVLQTNSNLVAT